MKACLPSAAFVAASFVVGLGCALCPPAFAEPVPFSCSILPDGYSASLMLTNPFDHDASCLASCQFSTAKYDVRPQITCVKPVPAGKEVQMCILTSSGEKLQKLMNSRGDCTK
jgi:hypothetical protein